MVECRYCGAAEFLYAASALGAEIVDYGSWLTPGVVIFKGSPEDHEAFEDLLKANNIKYGKVTYQ